MSKRHDKLDRRVFLKSTAAGLGAAAVGGSIIQAADQAGMGVSDKLPEVKVDPSKLIHLSENPSMEYRRLGRTNFMCSRIVAGWCRDMSLHRRLLASGVNYYDNARGYGNYEVEMKPFLKRFRDKVFLISKSTGIAGHHKIDDKVVELYRKAMKDFLGSGEGDLLDLYKQAIKKQKESGDKPDLRPIGKRIAEMYSRMIDESLQRMGVDNVDCYMMHGIEIPWIFDCLELWEAYEKAHKAGKAKHFGFSTHKHQKEVLAAAVEADTKGPWKIDIVMPAVNPGSFDHLKDELTAMKKRDIGIIAMKTKGIANRPVDGREEKFKSLTGGREYNEWERAKLWMLHLTEGRIDGCIAAVKNMKEMERTLALPALKLSAAAQRELRALVKLELAGTCHLCGACESVCPEQIAVTDMIRYHAYIHQYDEKEMARELYAEAGYDPSKLCSQCGRCTEVCPSNVRITDVLQRLSASMA